MDPKVISDVAEALRTRPLGVNFASEITRGTNAGAWVVELTDGRVFLRQVQRSGGTTLSQMGRVGAEASLEELHRIEIIIHEYLLDLEPAKLS